MMYGPNDNPSEHLASLRPDIEVHTLENGLRIFTLEDRSAPLVTLQIWFQVGSFNERPRDKEKHGTTGVSHFFEHMMFRGTASHPHYFEEIYALGGKLNAWTWLDATVYWEVVPSQHLQRVVTLEADRLKNGELDFIALETEREVIRAERLQRIDNEPMGVLAELLDATAIREHAYGWPTIGWMNDLNHLTLEEAVAHRQIYYVPNNFFIVAVGDFDTADFVSWIRDAYGDLDPSPTPVPDLEKPGPQPQACRDYVFQETQGPSFLMSYPVPAFEHPDGPIIEVVNQILNGGRSSRIQQALIYGPKPLVTTLSSNIYPVRHPYIYTWSISPIDGITSEEVLEAMDRCIETICTEPVTEEELERAIVRLQAGTVRRMLTNHERANLMGFGIQVSDDAFHFFDRLQTMSDIKPEDVLRVASTLFNPSHRTIVTSVAPGRVDKLCDVWRQEYPGDTLGEYNQDLLDIKLLEWQLNKNEEDSQQEKQAIEALRKRADHAMATTEDPVIRKSIELHMDSNEHGAGPRESAWLIQVAALEKQRADLVSRKAEIRTRNTEWPGGGKTANQRERLIDFLTGDDKTGPIPSMDTTVDFPAEAILWLLLCFELDARGNSEEPRRIRTEILDRINPEDTPNSYLTAVRAVAFDSQRAEHLSRNPLLGGGA